MHKGFDHVQFAENCKNSKHKMLITYNDNEHIRELFNFAKIHEVDVTYSMNKGKNLSKKELFISINY